MMRPRPRAEDEPSIPMFTIILAAGALALLTVGSAVAGASGAPVALAMADGGSGISLPWILLGGGGIVAIVFGAMWAHKPKSGVAKGFTIGGGVAAIVGVIIVVGGFGASAGVGAQGSASLGSAPAASVTDTSTLVKSVDVTFLVRDEITGYGIPSATVYLYQNSSGYTPQQMRERTVNAFALCSPTDSSGNCAYTGLQNQLYDVCVSVASGNYTKCEFGWMGLKDAVLNPTTGRGVYTTSPPLLVRTVGTISLSKTSTTISSSGCSAGSSTCALSLVYENSAANSYLRNVAFKLTPVPTDSTKSSATNLTFASIQQGSTCQYTTIGGIYYVWNPNREWLRTGEIDSCGINLQFASGAADGKITVAADDGFIPSLYASMKTIPAGDFETNNNWPNAGAQSVSVTR